MKHILFVCMGNICRSPLAEGFARDVAASAGIDAIFDSAGTENYHIGDAPDPRARAVARKHGIDIDALQARQVCDADFTDFDVILAADGRNLRALQQRQPAASTAELALLLPWCGAAPGTELPDPYYGDASHFDEVVSLLQDAMPALLKRLRDPS